MVYLIINYFIELNFLYLIPAANAAIIAINTITPNPIFTPVLGTFELLEFVFTTVLFFTSVLLSTVLLATILFSNILLTTVLFSTVLLTTTLLTVVLLTILLVGVTAPLTVTLVVIGVWNS